MTTKNRKSIYLQTVTVTYPAMCWIEIRTEASAQVDQVSNQVELVWLTRYPSPSKVMVHPRNEFLAEFKTLIQAYYDIKVKPIT